MAAQPDQRSVRAAAEQARTRFEAMLQSAPDATFVADQDGAIVFANDAMEVLLGYAPQQLIGRDFHELMPQRHRGEYLRLQEDFLERPRRRAMAPDHELAALAQDGTEVPVDVSFSPLPMDQGVWVVIALRDARPRRRLEARLRFREELARSLSSRTADLEAMLTETAALVLDDLADIVGLAVVDATGGHLDHVVVQHRDPARDPELAPQRLVQVREGQGMLGWVWHHRERLWLNDVDEAASPVLGDYPEVASFVERFGIRSLLGLPIVAKDRVVGVLSVTRVRPHANFGADEVDLLTEVAEVCGLAIANAQLNEEYRLLAEQTSDVVTLCSPDLTILWASPSWRTLLGRDPATVVGNRLELVHPDDRQEVLNRYERAIAGGETSYNHRYRVLRGDGTSLWINSGVSLVPDSDGSVSHVIQSMRDITQILESERALIESEELFRTAMTDSGVGMALIGTDGSMLRINDALCRFLGLPEEALVGSQLQDLRDPQDLAVDLKQYQEILEGRARTYRTSTRFLRPDGTELVGDLTVSAIRGADGTLKHVVVQIIDVTKQVRTTWELAQSEEHFRLLADNTGDVVARSHAGVLQWVSRSVTDQSGWEPEELAGRRFADLAHPDDVANVERVQADLAQGIPVLYECRVRGKDGHYRWFAIKGSAIPAEGDVPDVVASWRNIDEEVAARQLAAQREAEFRLLAEHASDLVIRVSADGRIEWASPSVKEKLGWDSADLIGHDPAEFVLTDDLPDYLSARAVLIPGVPARRTTRIRAKDRSYRWFASIATAVVDDAGRHQGIVIGMRSVDNEVRAMEELATSVERVREAMAAAPGGMAVLDEGRHFVEVNDALMSLTGRNEDWLLRHELADIMPPEDAAADAELRQQVMDGLMPSGVMECRLLRPDGTALWTQQAVARLGLAAEGRRTFVSQFLDVTEAKASRDALEFAALHDPLTRLPNRRGLVDAIRELQSQTPRKGEKLGLLFLDLDGLKKVNDTYGHAVGDDLIVQTAERIVRCVRSADVVARLAGDEFVILLPSVHDADNVRQLGDKIRAAVARPLTLGGSQLVVTASIGGIVVRPGEPSDAAVERADRALYAAKEAGRNRTVVDPADM